MAAFRLAAEAAADYLELDVHLSADGILVVVHDADIRLTDGRVDAVSSLTADELSDEGVPLLSEVLDLVAERNRLGATVEAKGAGTGGPIAATIARSPSRDRLSVCSFHGLELDGAHRTASDVPRILIVDRDDRPTDLIAIAREASVAGINVPLDWLEVATVKRLHDAGFIVLGGTVDDAEGVSRAVELGVDAIDSNDPARAVPVRDALVLAVN